MAFTPTLTLPLPSTPDPVYTNLWSEGISSEPASESSARAFKASLDARDAVACVVCHMPSAAEYCRIIPEEHHWETMRRLGYIPSDATSASHEPRNGILLCINHAFGFEHYQFYIRWNPETDEFVVVNHSQEGKGHEAFSGVEAIHGNVLDFKTSTTQHCPLPTAFLFHEARVRAFNPTHGDRPVALKRGEQRRSGPCSGEWFGKRGEGKGGLGLGVGTSGVPLEGEILNYTPEHMAEGSPPCVAWMEAARRLPNGKS